MKAMRPPTIKRRPRKVAARQSPAGPALGLQRVLSLTTARSTLPTLLKRLVKTRGTVGIAVHGKLQGYLLAPKALEELKLKAQQSGRRGKGGRSVLFGSLELIGDLDEGNRKTNVALKASLRRTSASVR